MQKTSLPNRYNGGRILRVRPNWPEGQAGRNLDGAVTNDGPICPYKLAHPEDAPSISSYSDHQTDGKRSRSRTVSLLLSFLSFLLILSLAACGRTSPSQSKPIKNPIEEKKATTLTDQPTTFDPERGLQLSETLQSNLKLTTSSVAFVDLSTSIPLKLEVFRDASEPTLKSRQSYEHGNAYACATILPEQAGQIHSDAILQISTPSQPSKLLTAKVLRIEGATQKFTGNLEVIAEIVDRENLLALGNVLDATVTLDHPGALLAIPRTALLKTTDGSFVYVVRDKCYKRTEIFLGRENDQFIEVKSGLSQGDTMVTHPVQTLWLMELQSRTTPEK